MNRTTMTDDRIDLNDQDDVRRWAKRLDATEEQIRDAVDTVGDRASEVELHLKGSRSTTNADQQARGGSPRT
ncbi:MAG TPA: DUF3606 domain-containing protein [Burkholderiaceae bacterium]|nr:DUF3606 domain-containing protein [Burkholderiaceae bacterium]